MHRLTGDWALLKIDSAIGLLVSMRRSPQTVLPLLCRYFLNAFLGATGGDGATLQVQHSATQGVGPQTTQPMHARTGSGSGGANSMEPPEGTQRLSNNGLRRGASIFFKESARMLKEIFEFIYLGQIAAVEEADGYGNVEKDEYNVWMFLLTWCAALAIRRFRLAFGAPCSLPAVITHTRQS